MQVNQTTKGMEKKLVSQAKGEKTAASRESYQILGLKEAKGRVKVKFSENMRSGEN